jgi:hypothetical protein
VNSKKKEFSDALSRVSLQDKEQLRRWLVESNRKYMLINSLHFVEALSMEDLELFQQMLIKYKNYRNTIPTGYTIMNEDGKKIAEVYGELLDDTELRECSVCNAIKRTII